MLSESLEVKTVEPVLEPASQDVDQESSSMALKLPLRPTPAYLAIAHSSPRRAPLPGASRKLLVLDLNGTLLLRPKPRNSKHRAIHPRPYMPAFRSYLFNEAVKPWLEVMVWSSAQPHSVNDMVERCFVDRRGELKAVWARDTLDLDAASYSRKVQTTKDLAKLWSLPESQPQHSAETTLLLDDSPLKAYLQPYNHFCVPEYTQNLRNRDLGVKETIRRQKDLMEEAQAEVHVELSGARPPAASAKRKRKSKPTPPVAHTDTINTVFDPTLLAVIGVLEEVKEHTNVAGWIRAGGLWAGLVPPRAPSPLELFLDSEGSDTSKPPRPRSRTEAWSQPGGNPGNDAVLGEDETMWFDHEPCFEYWLDRGTRAVKALGIELDPGIDR